MFYVGIFAVIQNMKFRRNETTNECIDYINFRDPLNDNSSGRMCGDFNLQEFQAEGQFFANFGGKVITEIFISKEKLEAGKIMDIQIAYTAFSRKFYHSKYIIYHLLINSIFCFKDALMKRVTRAFVITDIFVLTLYFLMIRS